MSNEILISLAVAVTALAAFVLDRQVLGGVPPKIGRLFALIAVEIGVVLLYHSLVLVPAILELPDFADRLAALGSVVEVPWWIGAGLIVVGGVGLGVSRAP